MSIFRPYLRLVLVTLGVIIVSSLLGQEASACAMTMANGSKCGVTAQCGCCSASPQDEVKSTPLIAPVRSAGSSSVCPIAAVCVCGSDRPSAPEPRSGRVTSLCRVLLTRLISTAPRVVPSSVTGARLDRQGEAHRSQLAPIYLRCSRFLI